MNNQRHKGCLEGYFLACKLALTATHLYVVLKISQIVLRLLISLMSWGQV